MPNRDPDARYEQPAQTIPWMIEQWCRHNLHTCLPGLAGIEPRTRNALLIAVQPLAAQVGVAPACQALGVSRATFYRRQRSTPGHQQPRPTPARALCQAEREQVLDVLAGPRFVDRAPAEVMATLLDEGHYLCSTSA